MSAEIQAFCFVWLFIIANFGLGWYYRGRFDGARVLPEKFAPVGEETFVTGTREEADLIAGVDPEEGCVCAWIEGSVPWRVSMSRLEFILESLPEDIWTSGVKVSDLTGDGS